MSRKPGIAETIKRKHVYQWSEECYNEKNQINSDFIQKFVFFFFLLRTFDLQMKSEKNMINGNGFDITNKLLKQTKLSTPSTYAHMKRLKYNQIESLFFIF